MTSEVILDYKGSLENAVNDPVTMASQQILTYSWLRNRRAQREIVAAGAVVFVNDLLPDGADPNADPSPRELDALLNQAIEPIGVSGTLPEQAVRFFDTRGTHRGPRRRRKTGLPLEQVWLPTPEKQTCAACDAATTARKAQCSGQPASTGSSRRTRPEVPAMLTDSQRRAAVVASRKNLGPETL